MSRVPWRGKLLAGRPAGDARPAGLGRRGDLLLSNEETWAQRQLERAGFSTWYVPLADVRHEMSRERLISVKDLPPEPP
ncbi:MAG: hypothetical protein WD043_07730, partial [Gemmatimonadales bacterium]